MLPYNMIYHMRRCPAPAASRGFSWRLATVFWMNDYSLDHRETTAAVQHGTARSVGGSRSG